MSLFSSKVSYLGVDIGSASVKMVELAPVGKRPKLVTYGYAEQPLDVIRSDSKESEERLVALVKKVYKESRVTTKKTIAALPSFSVFSSIISLPNMKKKELDQAVRWEAKKFVPMPVEEMTLYWQPLAEDVREREIGKDIPAKEQAPQAAAAKIGAVESTVPFAKIGEGDVIGGGPKALAEKQKERIKEKKNIKVLLTAAPKSLVEHYVRVFQAAGLELLSLETEGFALERSLVGNDKSPVMIVDIGAVSSDISIVEKGMPILTRSIDVGGITITNAIVNRLGVDVSRAEQFKRDIGFSTEGGGQGVPKTIETTISPIVNEIKYAFDIYLSQEGATQVDKIILTGGSAFLPNIVDHIAKILEIKVLIGDPWARLIYPLEIKSILQEIGPRFSIAIGLAMREIV